MGFCSPTIVLILTLSSAAALDELFTAVAEKCCPTEAFQCCYDAIDFNLRLSCIEVEANITETIRCMQTELHGQNDTMETGIDHIGCCNTFKNDQTDPLKMCYETCDFALQSPSIKSSLKLWRIEECRMTNPLYSCFNDCRTEHSNYLAKGVNESVFYETELCASFKIKIEEEVH